jgi:HSP20 family protein
MVKRIKPVSRIIRIEAELTRIANEVFAQRKRIPWLDESWVPCADVSERATDIILEVELPGVLREDVTILVSSSRIEIRGSKREPRPPDGARYIRLEREYGPFSRMISLPGPIIPEEANAVMEDGVLILTLRKYRNRRNREVIVPIRKTGD